MIGLRCRENAFEKEYRAGLVPLLLLSNGNKVRTVYFKKEGESLKVKGLLREADNLGVPTLLDFIIRNTELEREVREQLNNITGKTVVFENW